VWFFGPLRAKDAFYALAGLPVFPVAPVIATIVFLLVTIAVRVALIQSIGIFTREARAKSIASG